MEETTQRKTCWIEYITFHSDLHLHTGMESNNAALLEQDPPLLSDHQSEGSVHSEENQPSLQTRSGDMTETDLNQNQLPPTEDP